MTGKCGRLNYRGILGRPRPPAKTIEGNGAPGIERDLFPLEEQALDSGHRSAVLTDAHLAAGVDHAVPGNWAAFGKRGERVSDEPRLAGEFRETGDLTVGRHAAARDPGDDGVDAGVRRREA